LGVDVNKQALLAFLGEYTTRYYSELGDMPYPGDSLYIARLFTDPNVAKKISSVGVSSCADLYCSHEEADTRMLLHAMHADKEFGRKNTKCRIIVKSPDTDVFVLCVHFFPSMSNIKELWFQTGTITRTKDCRRYLPVHDICSMIGSVLCRVLPADHALTGCDTTSSFFGVGKKTMYKVLKDSQKEFVDLSQISYDDIETSIAVGRKFVARLYDPKARFTCDHDDLNKLRSRIAQQKDASLVKLPPCEATFRQHVLRVSLQVYIWTSLSIAQPPVKSPL
jgi:hypothetical protein